MPGWVSSQFHVSSSIYLETLEVKLEDNVKYRYIVLHMEDFLYVNAAPKVYIVSSSYTAPTTYTTTSYTNLMRTEKLVLVSCLLSKTDLKSSCLVTSTPISVVVRYCRVLSSDTSNCACLSG